MERAFTNIYQYNHWSKDHKNGPGSTLTATTHIQQLLTQIIQKYQITSIVDAPCGLYTWINQAIPPTCRYIGLDIVKVQIEDNNRLSQNIDKDLQFLHVNLTQTYPPVAKRRDLIFCKHFTQHLSQASTLRVLQNFRASGCKYLLISDYSDLTQNTEQCEWLTPSCPRLDEGAYRPQNLQLPPYNLTQVIEKFYGYTLYKLTP